MVTVESNVEVGEAITLEVVEEADFQERMNPVLNSLGWPEEKLNIRRLILLTLWRGCRTIIQEHGRLNSEAWTALVSEYDRGEEDDWLYELVTDRKEPLLKHMVGLVR